MTDNLINQAFKTWANIVRPYACTSEMDKILNIVLEEERVGKTVWPLNKDVFSCFKECDYSNFKVLFLGIDPYMYGEANGLSYSIEPSWQGVVPAATRNILIQLQEEYPGIALNPSFYQWASQGFLMLNQALTIVEGKTRSHIEYWKPFTRFLFKELSERNTGIIYVLLGKESHEYEKLINTEANYVLKYAHPASESTSAGNSGFFDSDIFQNINKVYKSQYGIDIIY